MAKGKIFIGEIMGDMIASLGSLETAMDNQVLKMDEQIVELQTVNTSIGQAMDKANVRVGDTVLNLVHAKIEAASSSTEKVYASCKLFCTGSIKIGAVGRRSASAKGDLYYRLNGGAWAIFGELPNSSPVEVSANIAVTANDYLEFAYKSNTSTVTIEENSTFIKYDLINLVTEGIAAQTF